LTRWNFSNKEDRVGREGAEIEAKIKVKIPTKTNRKNAVCLENPSLKSSTERENNEKSLHFLPVNYTNFT